MGKRKPRDKRLFVARKMPVLRRKQPGNEYAYKTDKVLQWISNRPGLQMYILDKLNAGGYIVYDKATSTWRGVDYDS